MKTPLSILASLSLLLFALSAPAQAPQAMAAPKLGANDVAKFIKAFPALAKEFKEFEKLVPAGGSSGGANPMGAISQLGAGMKAQGKLQEFAKSNGYGDAANLMTQTGAILSAYWMLKYEEALAAMKAQAASMPAETQALFKAQMQTMDKQMEQSKKLVSKETLSAVKAKLSEIDAMLEKSSRRD